MTTRSILFVWENFGPMHVDRVDAVAQRFAGEREVVGIEIASGSHVYDWVPESGRLFRKVTLFQKPLAEIGTLSCAVRIISACLREHGGDIFMCHYEQSATFIAASFLRLLGRRVYAMGCSKFDDYRRVLWREVLKSVFYWPYRGGISSGKRARDYMRFLGLPAERIKTEYNTLSIERIRKLAGVAPAPEGTPFEERHFTIVARFVPKKNIAVALDAYALYRKGTERPRPLHLCGSGPLETELRQQAQDLGISADVHFRGFLQTDGVARILGTTLTLLLPSIEEQFGNVVIEAQAMGVPVILSDNCGARDLLIRSGVNGFVVEPDNVEGLAYFMSLITVRSTWIKLSASATLSASLANTDKFVGATCELLHGDRRP